MNDEDYILEMCSSKASWQVIPKNIEAVNLAEVASKITAAGWNLRIETKFCYIFEGKAKLTLYPSGKLLIKTETSEMAKEIAKLHTTEWVMMEITTHLISRLESNEVVVFPTSTQPGLACLPTKEGLDSLFKVKSRDASKPVSLGVAALDDVRQLVKVPEHAQEFLDSFTPGSITLLMDAINEQDQRLGGKMMAIRILSHPLAKKLAECVGPITATSANLAGTPVSSNLFLAAESLGLPKNAVLVGECEGGPPSTLVQLGLSSTSSATVMREGVVPTKDVMAWRSRER